MCNPNMDPNILDIIDSLINQYQKFPNLNRRTHMAAVVNSNWDICTLGINDSFRNARKGSRFKIHAEMDAVDKLNFSREIKKRKKREILVIDLFVIRANKDGKLKNSKPCQQCLNYIDQRRKLIGFKINNIYYSDENSCIVCHKFDDLLNKDDQYISRYFRTREN